MFITNRPQKKDKKNGKKIKAFIIEMENKDHLFDVVDSLRLIDLYTTEYGVLWSGLQPEAELTYMYQEIKKTEDHANQRSQKRN